MYEGWTRLLIVYFTHVLIVGFIPATGIIAAFGRGLLQASAAIIMHTFSDTGLKVLVEYAYWGAVVFWIYLKVEKESKV